MPSLVAEMQNKAIAQPAWLQLAAGACLCLAKISVKGFYIIETIVLVVLTEKRKGMFNFYTQRKAI